MKTIPQFEDCVKQELGMAELSMAMESDLVFSCRLAIYLIQWSYYNCKDKKAIYRDNPMNRLKFTLLEKTMVKCSIDTFSVVDELIGKVNLTRDDIVGMKELKNHRHYHSHVYADEYFQTSVQKFVDEDQHHHDDIALRVWQVRSSVIQLMLKNNVEVKEKLSLKVTKQMLEVIVEIINSSCMKPPITDEATILTMLKGFSAVLTAKYCSAFQDEHKVLYSDGPLIF